jgi:iron-sulfur cluster insertion protein
MNAVTEMPAPIVFTESAAAKVKQLIDEEGNADLKLRVFVSGGGCSGFQYGFTFDEVTNEDDTVMQKNGVTLLIDAMSYQYLVGAEIAVRDQEPERLDHVRVRVLVLGLIRDRDSERRLRPPFSLLDAMDYSATP